MFVPRDVRSKGCSFRQEMFVSKRVSGNDKRSLETYLCFAKESFRQGMFVHQAKEDLRDKAMRSATFVIIKGRQGIRQKIPSAEATEYFFRN
jgi:hypothetical protein